MIHSQMKFQEQNEGDQLGKGHRYISTVCAGFESILSRNLRLRSLYRLLNIDLKIPMRMVFVFLK